MPNQLPYGSDPFAGLYPEPELAPEPVINPGPKTASGTKVFGVAAKQNIGGAAGGLLGAAGAGALAGSVVPGLGTVGGFAVGLGGALLGGGAGNWLQSVLDPTYEEDAQFLAEQYPEHKYAAIAGTLAPNLIGMRPSLAPLKQLRTIPGTLAKQKAGGALGGSSWRNLTAEQQNALLNVGAGVGLGAAPSVNQLVRGEDVDIAELLAGVGSGALITQPRRFMSRLGMHPSLSPEQEYQAIHDLALAKTLQDAPAPVIPDQAIPPIDPNALAQEELLQRGLRGFIAPTDLPGAPVPTVTDDGVLTLIKPAHTKSTVTEEGKVKNVRVPAEQVGNPEALPIGYNLRAAKGSQKKAAEKAAMQEWEALLDAETRNKAEARKQSSAEEQFSPGAEMRDEVPTLGEARAAEYLRTTNKRQTPEYHEAYAKYGKLLRGVETAPQSEIQEAGKYTPRATGADESIIETGQGRGFGTMPHELTHDAADFLRRSPRKQDNRLHELTIEAIQNDPKYKAWKAAADEQNARKGWKYSTEPEEYWAREAGAAKDLRIFDETPEVRNRLDRESATRVVDGTASVDDYVRYANNLMQYGPSFHTVMQRYGGKFGQLNAPVAQTSIAAQIPDDTDKLPADMFKAKALGLAPGAKLSERRAAMKELAQQHLAKYPDAEVLKTYPQDYQNIMNQLRGKGSASTQREREATAAKIEADALAAGKTADEAKALAEAERAASVRTRGFEPRDWNAAAKAKVAEHTLTPELFGNLRSYVRRRIQKQQGYYNDLEGDVYLSPQDVDHLVEQSMWDLTEGRWSEAKGSEGKMPEFIASQKPNTRDFNNTLREQLYRIGDNKLKTWRKENKLQSDVELAKVQVDTEGRIYRPEGSDDAATSPDLEARTDTAEERDLRDIYEKSLDPDSRYYQWTAAPEEFNRAFLNLQKRMGLFRNFGIHEINAFKRRLLSPFDESVAKVSARHRDELGKFQLAAEEVWNMPQDEQAAFLSGWRKRVQQNTKLTPEAKLAAERAVDDLAKQFEERWHPMNRVELERQAKELADERAFKRKYKTQDVWKEAEAVEAGPKPVTEDVQLGRTYEERGFKPGEELPTNEPDFALKTEPLKPEAIRYFQQKIKDAEYSLQKLRNAEFGVLKRNERIAEVEKRLKALRDELGGPAKLTKPLNLRAAAETISAFERQEQLRGPALKARTEKWQRAEEQYSISSIVPDLFKAEIDLVKRLDPDLGKAFERADRTRARLTGYLNNEPLHLLQSELALKPEGRDNKTFMKDLLANDSPDHRYVVWYRDQIMNSKKPNVTLTPRQQRINDAVELILKRTYDEREKNPLTKHDTKQTPGYLPGMMDLKIAREIEVNRSGKIAQDAIKAQEDWLAAEYGRGSKEFKDRMGRFLGAFDKKQMNSAEQFGPIDLNEGIGLAPELRDKNLNRLMSRFARRFAERMAFANEVQSDAKAMARLQDDKVSLKSNPHVKNVLDRMNGVREEQEEVRMAIGGAIRSMMLQTKTGLGDVTTSFPITMKHLSAKQLGGAGMAWARGAYEGLTRKSDLFRETLRQGVNVDNSVTMEMGEDGAKNIANALNGIRNITNKATGRNWLEQIARTGVYEEGKWLAAENVQAVLRGTADAQQKKFVEDFFDKPEFTPEAIREAATRFVEVNQGTYGYRGLPAISEKGSTAPFLSLSRWNIEQLNNFDKFVFQPALKGNYQPLLMATLGGLIGGAAVEQLYEVLSNRKSRLPTVSEISASKQPVKGTLYKLAGLASLAGFAGFYGDMARTAGDISFGNRAQGLTNPLWNGMQDFANIAADFATAVADGNIEDAATQLLPVLLQTYVQNARLLHAQMDDDEMKRRDSFRDVRMFNALNEGEVTPAIADQPNPFTNVGLRKFKKTSDLNEAAELLPGLLEGAVGRSGGDPEKIEREFGKIKANSYQTMPSPERRPLEFARYMEYLTKTQGPEAAAERFVDYQKQNAINRAKTAMVP